MPYTEPFSFGSIPILRSQLVSMNMSTRINQHLGERVNNTEKIIPQSNDFNYLSINLVVGQEHFILWRDYFVNGTALQRDLNLGYFTTTQYIAESMEVSVIESVYMGAGLDYLNIYQLKIEFIRSV